MPWLPGRVPDDVRALARHRLDAVARPRQVSGTPSEWEEPPTVPQPEPDLADRLAARLPSTVRGGRVVLSRSAAAGVAVVALAAVVLAGSYVWRARPVEAVLPSQPAAASAPPTGVIDPSLPPGASSSPAGSAGGAVVVDVAGKVRHPGVFTLALGSRVVDAIEAAGGTRGQVDLTSINLARVLTDGEQVLVGVAGGGLAPSGGAGGGTPDPAVIDLNTATLDQLETLPGVGPVLGQRILDWRAEHGRFSSIDELREVSGIGDSRFADIAPHVRV